MFFRPRPRLLLRAGVAPALVVVRNRLSGSDEYRPERSRRLFFRRRGRVLLKPAAAPVRGRPPVVVHRPLRSRRRRLPAVRVAWQTPTPTALVRNRVRSPRSYRPAHAIAGFVRLHRRRLISARVASIAATPTPLVRNRVHVIRNAAAGLRRARWRDKTLLRSFVAARRPLGPVVHLAGWRIRVRARRRPRIILAGLRYAPTPTAARRLQPLRAHSRRRALVRALGWRGLTGTVRPASPGLVVAAVRARVLVRRQPRRRPLFRRRPAFVARIAVSQPVLARPASIRLQRRRPWLRRRKPILVRAVPTRARVRVTPMRPARRGVARPRGTAFVLRSPVGPARGRQQPLLIQRTRRRRWFYARHRPRFETSTLGSSAPVLIITGFFDRPRAAGARLTETAAAAGFGDAASVANLEERAQADGFDPPDPHAP